MLKTVGGYSAQVLSEDAPSRYNRIGVVNIGVRVIPVMWDMEGKSDHESEDLDLAKEKVVYYVNIFSAGPSSVWHKTREGADSCATLPRIACIRIEYEEGQFDD